ncbi:MAG TPA: class I SAM-dependent methyltransferase [Cyclobacteriaceae bacterium]|nr:class I SAM-dependent methyltransferase [Cyclobacteriaceae bacterium]HRF32447.1 class I SAM-dependent methyltransferase [Cyclobacteriaceae bacterium]
MSDNKNYIPALKYDWLTRIYDPVLQLTMPERKFKSALINQMKIQANDKVLDFGCGSLTLSIMAAQKNKEAEFHGVDIDEKILSIAKKKVVGVGITIQTKLYDGGRLPYPDSYFDKVMSSLVFHHLTLRQKYGALDEIMRVLKPSGTVNIADFGKPANVLQRTGFYAVQLLDGFETTQDSVKNVLPNAIRETGFLNADENGVFNTMVGTVRIFSGLKPNHSIL